MSQVADSPSQSSSTEMHCDVDPSAFLAMQPKKSILKAKQHESFDTKEGRAHFDEMNILATHHPADKDYGHMKIEEPKTPYHYSDGESEADDAASVGGSSVTAARPRRVSLVGPGIDAEALAEGLAGGGGVAADKMQILANEDSDSEEEMTEEKRAKKDEFEKKRRAHYNEGAVLKQHIPLEDEDDEEAEEGDHKMK